VPAGSLGFSVMVFLFCAVICILTLLIRRQVVGGELGGSPTGRIGSCLFLCFLWIFYITMSILQSGNVAGLADSSWGINLENKNPNAACNK